MRRALFTGVLPVITTLAALATASPAQAREPEPVTITPFTLPGRVICESFAVDVGVISNNEHQETTTLADGTTITHIRGELVLSFKNDATGRTIVRNVSGPTTTIVHPDSTGIETGTGNNWWGFGPKSKANTGEPGLVFTSGLVALKFTGNVVTRFTLDGRQVNACNLLAKDTAS
jgi:hypothetical protein